MSKRETKKVVELSGKRWSVGKFDALTGSYIVYRLLFQMLPMGMEQQAGLEGLNLPQNRGIMGKQEFIDLQKDCLSVCKELVMVGAVEAEMPIMSNGEFIKGEVQEDTMLVMALTVHALIFNVTSFFEGDALKDLMTSFQNLTLSNA